VLNPLWVPRKRQRPEGIAATAGTTGPTGETMSTKTNNTTSPQRGTTKEGSQKLSYELIEAQPRDFDFSQGYPDDWDVALDLTDEELENGDYSPMMNYIYPLGAAFAVPSDARERLANMTIVRIGDEYFLALTGGGMDMTWEICESYINLGYYPPVQYCRLPRISGRGESAKDRQIIECCNESLRAAAGWYAQRLKDNQARFPQ